MRVWVEAIRTSPGRVFTENIVGRNQSTAVICILGYYSHEREKKRTDMLIQSSCFMMCIRSFSTS